MGGACSRRGGLCILTVVLVEVLIRIASLQREIVVL